MRVEVLSPAEWNHFSEHAHLVCFNEVRPAVMNTFDFALLVQDEESIFGYATVIEMDNETAYMQHGGAFPSSKGTTLSLRTYAALIDWLKAKYARITTRVENKNVAMLKFAMSQGLLIHGCDCYPGEVFLHLKWEK